MPAPRGARTVPRGPLLLQQLKGVQSHHPMAGEASKGAGLALASAAGSLRSTRAGAAASDGGGGAWGRWGHFPSQPLLRLPASRHVGPAPPRARGQRPALAPAFGSSPNGLVLTRDCLKSCSPTPGPVHVKTRQMLRAGSASSPGLGWDNLPFYAEASIKGYPAPISFEEGLPETLLGLGWGCTS